MFTLNTGLSQGNLKAGVASMAADYPQKQQLSGFEHIGQVVVRAGLLFCTTKDGT